MSQNIAPESYLGISNKQEASSANIDTKLLPNVEKSHSTEGHLSQPISSSGPAQQAFKTDQPSFSGDIVSKEYTGEGLDADNSDLWMVGSNSNQESAVEDDDSADEMGVVVSEKLGVWATELRDEVMSMKPSLQQQEEEDESLVTKAQLLLRDAVQYRHKLAALKHQYSARIDQVSSSLSVKTNK